MKYTGTIRVVFKPSWITQKIEAYRKRRALRNIRASLIAFGIPVEGMTDDELEARTLEVCNQISTGLRQFGVTMGEATEAFKLFGKALASAEEDSKL